MVARSTGLFARGAGRLVLTHIAAACLLHLGAAASGTRWDCFFAFDAAPDFVEKCRIDFRPNSSNGSWEASDLSIERVTWRGPYLPDLLSENGTLNQSFPVECGDPSALDETQRDAFDERRFCTGGYAASGAPPAGTPCASACVEEAGAWGGSWCWVEPEGAEERHWGASCEACPNASVATLPEVWVMGQNAFATMPDLLPVASRGGGLTTAVCYCGAANCTEVELFGEELGMIYFWTLRVCDVDGCRLDGGRVVPYLRVAPQQPFAVYVMCPPAGGCNSTSAGRLKLVRPSAANDLPSWHPLEGCSEAPEAAEVVWEAGAGQEDSERLDYRAWDSRRRPLRLAAGFRQRFDACFSNSDAEAWFRVGSVETAAALALSASAGAAVAGGDLAVRLAGGVATASRHDRRAAAAMRPSPYEAQALTANATLRLLAFDRGEGAEASLESRLGFNDSIPRNWQQVMDAQCRLADNASNMSYDALPSSGDLLAGAPPRPAGVVAVCYCAMLDSGGSCGDSEHWLFVAFLTVRGPAGGQVWEFPTALAVPVLVRGWGLRASDRLRLVPAGDECDAASPGALSGVRTTCPSATPGEMSSCPTNAATELLLRPLTASASGVIISDVRVETSRTVLVFNSSVQGVLRPGDVITIDLDTVLVNDRPASDKDTSQPADWFDAYRFSGEYEFQDASASHVVGHRLLEVRSVAGIVRPNEMAIPLGALAYDNNPPHFSFRAGGGTWTRRCEAETTVQLVGTSAQQGVKVCWGIRDPGATATTFSMQAGTLTFYEPPAMHHASVGFTTLQAGAIAPVVLEFRTAPQRSAYAFLGRTKLRLLLSLAALGLRFADDAPPECFSDTPTDCPEAVAIGEVARATQKMCGRLFLELWSEDEHGFPVAASCGLGGVVADASARIPRSVAIDIVFGAGLGLAANTRYMLALNAEVLALSQGQAVAEIVTMCEPTGETGSGGDAGGCVGREMVFERSVAFVAAASMPAATTDESRLIAGGPPLLEDVVGDVLALPLDRALRMQLSPEPAGLAIQTGSILRLHLWPATLWNLPNTSCMADFEVGGGKPLSCAIESVLGQGFDVARNVMRLTTPLDMNVTAEDPVNVSISSLSAPSGGFFPTRVGLQLTAEGDTAPWFTTTTWRLWRPAAAGETRASLLVEGPSGGGPSPFLGEASRLSLRLRLGAALGTFRPAAAPVRLLQAAPAPAPAPGPMPSASLQLLLPPGYRCTNASAGMGAAGGGTPLPELAVQQDDVCTVSVLDELRLYFGQVLYIQLNVTNPTTALHAGDPSNRWALRLGGAADPPERYILADAAFAPSADSRWTASVSVIPAFAGALLQPTVFARSCCEGARLGERLVRQWLRVFVRPTVPVGRPNQLLIDAPEGFDFGDTCEVRDLMDEYYAFAGAEHAQLRRLGPKTCVGDVWPAGAPTYNRARITIVSPRAASSGGRYGDLAPHYGFQLGVLHPATYSAEQQSGWWIWSVDSGGQVVEGAYNSVGFQDPGLARQSPVAVPRYDQSWGLYTDSQAQIQVRLLSILPHDLANAQTQVVVHPISFADDFATTLRFTAPAGFVWSSHFADGYFEPTAHGTTEFFAMPSDALENVLIWQNASFLGGVSYGFRHTIMVPSHSPRLSSNVFFLEFGYDGTDIDARPAALSVECPLVATLINCGVGYSTTEVRRANRIELRIQTITPIGKGGGIIVTAAGYEGLALSGAIALLPDSDPLPEGIALILAPLSGGGRKIQIVVKEDEPIPPGYYRFELSAVNPPTFTAAERWFFGTFDDVTLHPGAPTLDLPMEVDGFQVEEPMLLGASFLVDRFPNVTLRDPALRDDRPGQRNFAVIAWICENRPAAEELVLRAPPGYVFDESCLDSLESDLGRLASDPGDRWPNGTFAEWPAHLAPVSCRGDGRIARIRIPVGLLDEAGYALGVSFRNALRPPAVNEWSLSYCPETSGSWEGFPLWSFSEASVTPASYSRLARANSLTFSFRPRRAIPAADADGAAGLLRVEAPPGFRFLARASGRCQEVEVRAVGQALPWPAGAYRCDVDPGGRRLSFTLSGSMRMGDGLQYFVTSLADFPDKLGFAGDWMLQSYASARAEQADALDMSIVDGFDLHDNVAAFTVTNPVPKVYADLRPGRWVEGIIVDVQFNADVGNGDAIILRSPLSYTLVERAGSTSCVGYAAVSGGPLPFLGTGSPSCSCRNLGARARCKLEWSDIQESTSPALMASERLRFLVNAQNPMLTPGLAGNFWRVEHHWSIARRHELALPMRAQFTPPGIDPAITRYIPRDFVPERHARASSFAHSWTISDCFGIQPYAHAVDGGEPSVHRVFSIELVNVCGGLSLEDRFTLVPNASQCGRERYVSLTIGVNDSGSVGSTGDASTSVRWEGALITQPGDYRLCWCAASFENETIVGACQRGSDFREYAGVLQIRGPLGFHDAHLNPAAGKLFVLDVVGVGLTTQDRIRVVSAATPCNGTGANASVATLRGPPGCTGAFQEALSRAGNNRLRPPPRTPCASYCVYESGRWGGSWCWTEREGTPDRNWGAPCAPCANDADALELPGVGAEAERSWPGLAVLEPAPYRVCWCPGSRTGCAAGEHFDIEVGLLDAWGPEVAGYTCAMDRECRFAIEGVPPQLPDTAVQFRRGAGRCADGGAALLDAPGLTNPSAADEANATAYTHYRLVPLRTREGCSLSLSDIFLYSDGEALNLDSASGTFDGGEADAALDGNASTQFDDPNCSGVEVAMPSPTRVDAVSFVTAEGKDSIPSDLVAFRIEARSGAEMPWRTLLRVSDLDVPLERMTPTAVLPFRAGLANYSTGIPSGELVGTHTICWGADAEGPFLVEAGTLTLLGLASAQQDQWCFAGAPCTLGPILGAGLSLADRVLAVSDFGP